MVDLNNVTLEDLETFFFRSMLAGWVAGAIKITIPEMPGYKGVVNRESDLYLLDAWSKTPGSTWSSGSTKIFYCNVPVWEMHYGGHYAEEDSALVKAALQVSYASKEFLGGRGPHKFESPHDTMKTYINLPNGKFIRFQGREQVLQWDTNGGATVLGYHSYCGMSLLPRTK